MSVSSSTQLITPTIRNTLDKSNATQLPDLLRKLKLGAMLANIKVVVSGVTAADTFTINTQAFQKPASGTVTITGIDLDTADLENLPAIGELFSLRVTGSTGGTNVGPRIAQDAGATPIASSSSTVGTVAISDDGATINFGTGSAVTGFVLEYSGRAAVPLTTGWSDGAPA